VSPTAPRRATPTAPDRSWAPVLRWTAAVTLAGEAAIHVSVVESHARVWLPEGLFFVVLALAETALALAIAARRRTSAHQAAIALSLATVALWVVSRTAGVPVGPQPWVPEAVGRADAAATLLELATAIALGPIVLPSPGPAATRVALGATTAAAIGATVFALAPGGAGDLHEHGAGVAVRVPPVSPTGEFSLRDARRAARCAERATRTARRARSPSSGVTIGARDLCFDTTALTLAANRRVVVRLENRERSRGASRVHAFSIYAFSPVPALHHPVVIGDPVAPGARADVRFRAPPPGSYFFQCDIHRFMRGVAVFR